MYLLLQEGEKSMYGTCACTKVIGLLGVGVNSDEKQVKYFNCKLLSYRLAQLPASPSPYHCRQFKGRPFLIGILFQIFCERKASCTCKLTYNSIQLLELNLQHSILLSRIWEILLRLSS